MDSRLLQGQRFEDCCRGSVLKIVAGAAFLLLAAAAGAEKNWHLSVEPLFGLKTGELGEYVFLKKSNYSNDKLSELNWEFKPLFYYGARITGGWKAIEVSTSLTGAIPSKSGSMYDSDWVNRSSQDVSNPPAGYDYKTHFSESDNYLDSNVTWSISGGYTFKPKPFLHIKPFIGFDYDYMKFTAKGTTTYWYGKQTSNYYYAYNDTEHRTTGTLDGKVISYERQTCITWLGANATFLLPHGFSVAVGGQIAPYIYTYSTDRHYLRNTEFVDIIYGYFSAFKCTATASYAATEKVSVNLTGSYFFMKTLKGDDYSSKIGSNSYIQASNIDGGASARYWDFGFSVKYTFF